MPEIQVPGFFQTSDNEYHADNFFPQPTLSASIAGKIVSKSALHAFLKHPRLGGEVEEATRAMQRGTIFHSLLLDTPCPTEIIEAKDYKKSSTQEIRDAAILDGKVPILAHELAEVKQMVAAARRQLRAYGIVLDGMSEITAFWDEESECGPVRCRAKMDHVIPARGIIWDLKTIHNAHPRQCQRNIIDYTADVQFAAYTSALRTIDPDVAGREKMYFIFVESEDPFCVTVVELDGSMRQFGEDRWRRGVETWATCLAEWNRIPESERFLPRKPDGDDEDRVEFDMSVVTRAWAPYVTNVVLLDVPAWAQYQENEVANGLARSDKKYERPTQEAQAAYMAACMPLEFEEEAP